MNIFGENHKQKHLCRAIWCKPFSRSSGFAISMNETRKQAIPKG
jgi:hypothetical protein